MELDYDAALMIPNFNRDCENRQTNQTTPADLTTAKTTAFPAFGTESLQLDFSPKAQDDAWWRDSQTLGQLVSQDTI